MVIISKLSMYHLKKWCKNGAVVLSVGVGFREGEGRDFIAEELPYEGLGSNVAFMVQ